MNSSSPSLTTCLSHVFANSEIMKQVYVQGDYIILDIRHPYRIELSRCDTPAKIFGWIAHLAPKGWIKPRHIERFVVIACKAHGIEINRNM